MAKGTLTLATAIAIAASAAASFGDGTWAQERFYAGAAAEAALPQGGARIRALSGAGARFGCYLSEALALEGAAAWAEDRAALSAAALWHWNGWREYDLLFGYSRFDPFFTVGAKCWMHGGPAGPHFGAGALYYLGGTWALRFDAGIALGVDDGVETVHTLSLGLQFSF